MLTTLVKLDYAELKAKYPEKVKEARAAWMKSRSKHNRVRADRLSWGIEWFEKVDVAATRIAQAKGRRASMACRIRGVSRAKVICWYPKASKLPVNSRTLYKQSTEFSRVPSEVRQYLLASGNDIPATHMVRGDFYVDMPLVLQEYA